jgi:hypothetical protein
MASRLPARQGRPLLEPMLGQAAGGWQLENHRTVATRSFRPGGAKAPAAQSGVPRAHCAADPAGCCGSGPLDIANAGRSDHPPCPHPNMPVERLGSRSGRTHTFVWLRAPTDRAPHPPGDPMGDTLRPSLSPLGIDHARPSWGWRLPAAHGPRTRRRSTPKHADPVGLRRRPPRSEINPVRPRARHVEHDASCRRPLLRDGRPPPAEVRAVRGDRRDAGRDGRFDLNGANALPDELG